MTSISRYDTILFDLDGTLLNTLPDLHASVNATLQHYGYPLQSMQAVRSFIGNGVDMLVARSLPQGADTPQFAEICDFYRSHYRANCENETAPYPGIMALLTALQEKGLRIGIVSNKPDEAVKKLAEAYFPGFISAAVGETAAIPRKPAPDMVWAAARQLGCDLQRTLYVGDSETDVETASNAGVDLAAVSWGFRDRPVLKACGAEHIIDTPQELFALAGL